MRIAVTMVGLALLVSACGGGGSTTGVVGGATTGAGTTTGGTGTGGTTGATTTGGGASTGGVVDAGLPDGTACTANLACASHVCGMSGSGNCCSIACTSTNMACAASGCDTSGACIYPSMGADGGAAPACGGTCTKSLLDAFFCDTSGNCSVSTGQAFACPNNLGCDTQGEACNTSCTADSDCATGSFCYQSACSPRLQTGACLENDGCTSQVCGVNAGPGDCCTAACAPTKDPSCNATQCDANSGACVFPSGATCGTPACSNSEFNVTGDGLCDPKGDCVRTPVQCPGNFGCNAAGTACNSTCTLRSDCASGFYCNNDAGGCVPEIPLGSCFENDECTTDFCGTNLTVAGTGGCCAAMCQATKDPKCDPINCDATAGGCVYPAGFACGAATCTSAVLTFACNTSGACVANTASCANNLNCNAAGTDCLAKCSSDSDCVAGDYYCDPSGACLARGGAGATCPINDACDSKVCGGSTGSGHCCTSSCPDTVAACAATDCAAKGGACVYPGATTACGTTLASCANGIENDPSVCDGAGNCPTPGTSVCSPYICGATTCDTSCSDNTSCATASGGFCDTNNSACCSGLISGGTITVDGKKGKDTTACCGIGSNGPCATIGQAMLLIDSAKAQNVTINASLSGGGGTWNKNEIYPVTLGWGAELSAPGVYFYDKSATDAEIFDINFYSSNDTVGYASIVNTNIGWDENGDQPGATTSIMVEKSNTLYIANTEVNGSQNNMTNAITVAAGGTLTLGQDQSASNTGTVDIGSSGQDGWNGIVCQTDSKSLGCTITDANLGGTTAVDIQYQMNQDIDAEDFASISLTSSPIVGAPNSAAGFGTCSSKPDCGDSTSYPAGAAILLNGDVTMTYSNGTVQCISGYGIQMQATKNGTPTLTMDSTTIQNSEWAIYATAGTATISNSTIQYNYNGVQQGTDGTNIATIDLSGGGAGGTNTLACASNIESVQNPGPDPGVDVFDSTTSNLNASDCDWDTSAPDQFSCTNDTFGSCTCEISNGCTTAAGSDGMDTVYDSTGTITTTGNGTASQSCASALCGVGTAYPQMCQSGWQCCDSSYDYYPVYLDQGCCAPPDSESNELCNGYPCCEWYCD